MKSIGIDESRGDLYESPGGPWYSVWPASPILAVASVDNDLSIVSDLARATLIFREDHFDAVTRIRRGRFYKPSSDSRPAQCYAWAHPVHGGTRGSAPMTMPEGTVERWLHIFAPERLASSVQFVAIGDNASQWRVLGSEKITTGEYLVTLKARHALGILPKLDVEKVPAIGRAKAIETYDKLVDSANRESPGSTVDRARDAAQWLLGTWAAAQYKDDSLRHKDLAALASTIEQKRSGNEVKQWTARILARLHARVKPNEQDRYDVRPPMEADAEFALAAIGLLLREIGWAQ